MKATCHPSEIRPGDTINHAGAHARVLAVHHNGLHRNWRIDIRYEATGGVNWVVYPDRGQFSTVTRYQ